LIEVDVPESLSRTIDMRTDASGQSVFEWGPPEIQSAHKERVGAGFVHEAPHAEQVKFLDALERLAPETLLGLREGRGVAAACNQCRAARETSSAKLNAPERVQLRLRERIGSLFDDEFEAERMLGLRIDDWAMRCGLYQPSSDVSPWFRRTAMRAAFEEASSWRDVLMQPLDLEWEKQAPKLEPWNVTDGESEAAFRRRVDAYIEAAKNVMRDNLWTRSKRREALSSQHVEWFIRNRVLGDSQAEIAATEYGASAVRQAVSRVAKELGFSLPVSPSRRPPG